MFVLVEPRRAETARPSPKTSNPRSAGQTRATFIAVLLFWLRERCPMRSRRKPVVRPVTARVAFRRGGRDTRGHLVGHSQEGGVDTEISARSSVEQAARTSEPK